MAMYTSTSSSLAPNVFSLSSSFDDNNGAISVAVERCQLCRGIKRPFICQKCINSGDFCSSLLTQSHQSQKTKSDLSVTSSVNSFREILYIDKMNKWNIHKAERLKLIESIKCILEKHSQLESKKENIVLGKKRNSLITSSVLRMRLKTQNEKSLLRELQTGNKNQALRNEQHNLKKKKIEEHLNKIHNYTCKREETRARVTAELSTLRQTNVHHLTEHIFPIIEIQARGDLDSMVESTVSALADARKTSYIRGRWVYTDNEGERKYRIIFPLLPGNGDYSAYTLWAGHSSISGSSSGTEEDKQNPSHCIGAALTFTSQLVNLLSYFLDFVLPHPLCYSLFCTRELSEKHFHRAVWKMNQNVIRFCSAQKINPEALHPRHTLHNIMLLLNSSYLGRSEPYLYQPDMMISTDENSYPYTTDDSSSSDEDEASSTLPYHPIGPDWEQVPVTLPEADSSTVEGYCSSSSIQATPRMDYQTSSSYAPGASIFSSAAASVASFWKAATSQREDS